MNENVAKFLEPMDDDLSLMIEAGFVAIKQLDEVSARRLFAAAKTLRPESSAPEVGVGYIHLNKLEHKEATKIFQEVVDKEEDNELALSFLGMALMLNKERATEGVDLINRTLAATQDDEIKHLCESALKWYDHDLKEEKAPFFE